MTPSPQAPPLAAFLCAMDLAAAMGEALCLCLPRLTLSAGRDLLAG
ncbi:MAG: hypothetical protein ACRC7D_06695 [Aeromonas popoffii]